MAQSRVQAKNTFGEGLVMDFSPDNTLANALSNALNATLLTFNGNEMNLQNDMGNGRVETAFLPTGYMPVGTCELGGVIYVVSYNPQKDLCLIGSFPSPERNIESDELNTLQGLRITNDMFQGEEGLLKTTTAKVIIRTDSLNPGDKYIISASGLEDNLDCLSYLKSDTSRQKIKLKVVSIEDSGKITELETKSYDIQLGDEKYLYIFQTETPTIGAKTDIDNYRQKVSSNYNVFSSKVSGKLAVLAELETISGFSCSHRIVTTEKAETILYDVYLDYSWESDAEAIYPEFINITDWQWLTPEGDALGNEYLIGTAENNKEYINTFEYTLEDEVELVEEPDSGPNIQQKLTLPQLIKEDKSYFYHRIPSNTRTSTLEFKWEKCTYLYSTYENGKRVIHYTLNKDTTGEKATIETATVPEGMGELDLVNKLHITNSVKVCSFVAPKTMGDIEYTFPYKLRYAVTPAMKFGLLSHLTVENEIDFSKVGTYTIDLTEARYYATEDVLTLTIASDVYEEVNHKVTSIGLEFYDFNGFCGSLSVSNRESYSGEITWSIPLNSVYLDLTKFKGDTKYYHLVLTPLGSDSYSGKPIRPEVENQANDCGVLYYGMLYGVKVLYTYSELEPITLSPTNTYTTKTKSFWLYTTGEFNDLYYQTDDFRNLSPEIPLIYSFDLQDNTAKSEPQLANDTKTKLHELINGETDKVKTDTSLVEEVTYSGDMDLKVKIGIAAGGAYGLVEAENTEMPNVHLSLMSPYDINKQYSIVEAPEKTDTEESEDTENVVYYPGNTDANAIKIEKPTLSINKATYSASTKINLKLPMEFTVTPTANAIIKNVSAQVLTPILYKTSETGLFNYEDVGGEEMFTLALCYNGGDDISYHDGNNAINWTSNEHWLQINILDRTHYFYSSLKEYSKDALHIDLMSGDPDLSTYYSGLGNRQPFTLFTVQVPKTEYPSNADSTDTTNPYEVAGILYTYHYNHNLLTPTETDTNSSHTTKYKAILKQEESKKWTTTVRAPGYKDRPYIPAYITPGIANGEYGVYMTSSGGNPTSYELLCEWWNKSDNWAKKQGIPYTCKSITEIANEFYQPYLKTLKLMLTVNPDVSDVTVGSFEYDPSKCKDYLLNSYLVGYVDNTESLINNTTNLITFQGLSFSGIVTKTVEALGDNSLTDEDANVNIKFNTDALGSEAQKAPITAITYNMAHEHSLINDYANPEQMVFLKYLNYNLNLQEEWSSELKEQHITIDESQFYRYGVYSVFDAQGRWLKLMKGLHLLNSYSFSTTSDGLIRDDGVKHLSQTSSSSLAYTVEPRKKVNSSYFYGGNNKAYIFYGTNMLIEDFIWDPSNSKHHFLFVATSKLTPVAGAYSYQLDDCDGNAATIILHRKYYIGPSFQ